MLPEGSRKDAPLQTPESQTSLTSTPASSSAAFAAGNIRDAQAERARWDRRELLPVCLGSHDRERQIAGLVFDPVVELARAGRQAEHAPVEVLRLLDVGHGHPDVVDALDVDQPTEPSICSWISRFISTAYSSGSSLVIGSTKPETIIAEASVSESPRDIR